jgi:hypothetical protein
MVDRLSVFYKKVIEKFSTSDVLFKLLFLIFLLHLALSIVTQYTPVTEGLLSLIIFFVAVLLFFLFVLKILNDAIFYRTLIVREEFIAAYVQNETGLVDLLNDQLLLIVNQNFLIYLLEDSYIKRFSSVTQSIGSFFFIIFYLLFLKRRFLKYFVGRLYYKDFLHTMSLKKNFISKKLISIFLRLLKLSTR